MDIKQKLNENTKERRINPKYIPYQFLSDAICTYNQKTPTEVIDLVAKLTDYRFRQRKGEDETETARGRANKFNKMMDLEGRSLQELYLTRGKDKALSYINNTYFRQEKTYLH